MVLRSPWMRGSWRNAFFGDLSIRLLGFATWIPAIIWVKHNVADITRIHGASMHPYLNEDINNTLRRDVVLNYKYNPQDDLQRGMVVTFRSPYNPETIAVKRIIGIEGDFVQTRSPYPHSVVRIPQGHIWVEGDGPRDKSLDSNTYGPIAMRLVTGRITHILYPWHKLGRVRWWEFEGKRGRPEAAEWRL